jgi:N-acetylglucosaminyldiphosphoundecaprenol N-acetyl-beta-D-mannosaminyltransferase
MKFLEYKLTVDLPKNLPEIMQIANTINPHSYCVAQEDELFKNALLSSDILIPDGVGVVWAANFLYNKKINKISGFDMHSHFLNILKKRGGGKVFYLGASEKILSLIVARIKQDYPNLAVHVLSPPFKAEFSKKDNDVMIEAINKIEPDVLFVGMTAPKQEKWVYSNKDRLSANVICSIGAVFDFYAGTVQRPNQFWINMGLEWLPRFLKEPKRLWKRNLISTPKFIFEIIKIKSNFFLMLP